MIDLDAPAPCGCCGAPLTWEVRDSDADDDESPTYTAACGCGMEWEYAMAGMSWRDVLEYASVHHDGAYSHYLRELVAEVERLTRELAAATERGAAEERAAVVEFLRKPLDALWERVERQYNQGARDALCSAIDRIERGAHRKEAP